MKKVFINGEAFCKPITGVIRVAIDIINELDTMVTKEDGFVLVVPQNTKYLPELKNIEIKVLNYELKRFYLWEQIPFQKAVRKEKALSLDFSNTCPLLSPGVEYLHDIYCKLYPNDYHGLKEKLIMLYNIVNYKRIIKKAKAIIAVSEYTKKTIIDTYHVDGERIKVIYNGLSPYYLNLEPDYSILQKHPELKEKEFYFTLGTLAIRKNLKWIVDHAELYPNETFAISGSALTNLVPPELAKIKTLKNVIFLGYLSDAEVKAIMTRCKAFIFPSFFEGFGIPPLEALSCGAPIIISDRTCLPEIYGNTAHYINPDDCTTDLEKLLNEPVENPVPLLERFTIHNSAKQLLDVITAYRA